MAAKQGPPRDRLCIATSARKTAMGRYVMCGPTCFKKRSGPDSMSGDARARFLKALNKGQFVIGVDDQWMLAPVTEESLIDEGFTMAAAVQLQNEQSVENLVHVENSAVQGSVTCPARFDARSKGIRPHRIFGTSSSEERRLARDRDEGIPTIGTE